MSENDNPVPLPDLENAAMPTVGSAIGGRQRGVPCAAAPNSVQSERLVRQPEEGGALRG